MINGEYYLNNVQQFQAVVTEEDQYLGQINYNILTNDENIGQMQRYVWAIFQQNSWFEKFQIDFNKFVIFLNTLEQKYNKNQNTFHNFSHGVCVMQCCYSLALAPKAKKHLDELNIFGLTLSGLCHDVSHPAHTNIFAIKSLSKLALRYQDISPLEQHHAAVTFKIIKSIGLLNNLDKQQFTMLRQNIVQNILHTDNSNHQKLLKQFDQAVNEGFEDPQKKQQNIQLLEGMMIHAADFTGGVRDFEISMEWSIRCNNEFKNQYDLEGDLGIEQTPFMKDLDKVEVLAKGERGFFKMLVLPLWIQLNNFLEGYLDQNVLNLQQNIETWDKISSEPEYYKNKYTKLKYLKQQFDTIKIQN